MEISDILTLATLILSAISLVVGGSGLWVARSTKQKYSAESEKTISETAMSLVTPLNKRISVLHEQLAETELEVKRLRVFEHGVYVLIAQMREAGIVPAWSPPEEYYEETRDIESDKEVRGKKSE